MADLGIFELGILLLNAFFLGAFVATGGIWHMLRRQQKKIEKNWEEWIKRGGTDNE